MTEAESLLFYRPLRQRWDHFPALHWDRGSSANLSSWHKDNVLCATLLEMDLEMCTRARRRSSLTNKLILHECADSRRKKNQATMEGGKKTQCKRERGLLEIRKFIGSFFFSSNIAEGECVIPSQDSHLQALSRYPRSTKTGAQTRQGQYFVAIKCMSFKMSFCYSLECGCFMTFQVQKPQYWQIKYWTHK